MTAQELRETVVRIALGFLGRKEADGSHREIIDIYNSITPLPNGYRMKYTDPWCAAFVSAVAWLCGLISIIFPSASCPDMVKRYKAAGRWMESDAYKPQIGDIVFYDWEDSGSGDNTGTPDHVGIVTEVFSNSFNVVEGNASDSVKIRTMQANGRYIRGFGRPDYESMAGQDAPATEIPVVDEPAELPTDSLPVLRYGYGLNNPSFVVEAAQILLIGWGYGCGDAGHDGEFGADTQTAVERFQRDRGLEADGIIGPVTWAALLGVSVS